MMEDKDYSDAEDLESARALLKNLIEDCGRRMEKAWLTRQELQEKIDEVRGAYLASLGRLNLFRQEELRVMLTQAEREAREFDVELRELQEKYNFAVTEFMGLCEDSKVDKSEEM